VTPSTTGAIKIEQGGGKNITINHGCGGGDCGDGGNDGGNGGNVGGRESDGGVGCGRSLSPSMAAVTGAAKTKETMKTITAVVKATTGESSVMMTTMIETTNLAASAMAKAG
jgi:hypothetical protein